MNLLTFCYLRNGEVVFEGYDETHRTAQDYATRLAARTNPDYADEVHVWFGRSVDDAESDGPDAIAKVPR